MVVTEIYCVKFAFSKIYLIAIKADIATAFHRVLMDYFGGGPLMSTYEIVLAANPCPACSQFHHNTNKQSISVSSIHGVPEKNKRETLKNYNLSKLRALVRD